MSVQPKQEDLITSFLDEELAEGDIDALLDVLECSDARSRACRQSLASSLLNNAGTCCADISSQVRAAIQADVPVQTAPKLVELKRPRRSARVLRQAWLVPAAGLALAASVAMVAVILVAPNAPAPQGAQLAQAPVIPDEGRSSVVALGSRPQLPLHKVADGAASTAPRELVIAAPERARPVTAQWHSLGSLDSAAPDSQLVAGQLQRQLDAYLVNHARHGGRNALSGSLGYARVAASPQQADESQR